VSLDADAAALAGGLAEQAPARRAAFPPGEPMTDLITTDQTLVHVATEGRTAVITLNRPEARNAINGALASAIDAALTKFEADDELWAAVLTHNGPTFSAGADLKEVARGGGAGMSIEGAGFAGVCRRPRTKPLLAAVDGTALGGGLEICLACDLIVATRASKFGLPEVKRSVLAGAGGLVRLPRYLPRKLAMEMVLTGDPIDAQRAYDLGLVNVLVDEGQAVAGALELAERINVNAPLAVRASRKVVLEAPEADEDAGFAAGTREMQPIFETEDFKEGPRAFAEKRPPVWKAR
jgi:enoyl-CoA hydratase